MWNSPLATLCLTQGVARLGSGGATTRDEEPVDDMNIGANMVRTSGRARKPARKVNENKETIDNCEDARFMKRTKGLSAYQGRIRELDRNEKKNGKSLKMRSLKTKCKKWETRKRT
jgi:hypothetical protein